MKFFFYLFDERVFSAEIKERESKEMRINSRELIIEILCQKLLFEK